MSFWDDSVIRKSDHPWAHFLWSRRIVIEWMKEEGKTDEQIARLISMDPVQVRLLQQTIVER